MTALVRHGWLLLCPLGLAGAPAAADPPTALELRYQAPDDGACPQEQAFREMVSTRLGTDVWRPLAPVIASVSLIGAAGRYGGQMRLVDRKGETPGERRFSAVATCRELAETVAFALVLAIDPLYDEMRRRSTPPPAAPAPAAEVQTSTAPRPNVRVIPAFGVLGAVASAPEVTLGFSLEAIVAFERLEVGVEGRVELPRSAPLSGGGSIETALFVGGVVPCARLSRFTACFVMHLGAMRVSAAGLDSARSATEVYARLGVRGGYELPLREELGLRLSAGVGFVLTRISLTDLAMAAPTRYWTTPLVNGDLAISLVFHLW
jgi:hypothetical protein